MKYIYIILSLILFTGCEEVVEIDLATAAPRLVINASINWEKGTSGSSQTIKLTTTTGYYQTQIPVVSGATITVTNSSNTVFNFIETPNTGNYVCTNFVPILNENYTLKVIHNGQSYTASEKLLPTPDILDIEQKNDLGLNNDEIGLRITFKDYANQRNYYLFRVESDLNAFPEYQYVDDQFTDGNTVPWLYSHENLVKDKKIYFTQYGVSENYHNYIKLIINASAGANNGPFQAIPTKARGNIINQSNEKNYAFGYFRLGEIAKSDYTIK